MSGLDALYAQAEQEVIDTLMRQRFGTKPVDDPSGMFTGQSSLEPEPSASVGNEQTAPTMAELHQGPRAEVPDEDAAIDAYVQAFLPQAAT